jgi:hypothetical protein
MLFFLCLPKIDVTSLIVIYYKFNDNFKSYTYFGKIQRIYEYSF